MSEEMVEIKEKDQEQLDKEETEFKEHTKNDICPHCGTLTKDFLYMNSMLIGMFGLLECTVCGIVFSPESLRNDKLKVLKSPIIMPGGR